MNRFLIAGAAMALLPSMALADDMFRGVQTLAADGGSSNVLFDNLDPDVMRMSVGDRVTLNFGRGYEAELDRIGTQEMGAQVWVGRIADHSINNRVIITQTNGFTFGEIMAPDATYWIYPGRNGHEIMRIPDDAIALEAANDGLTPPIVSVETVIDTAIAQGRLESVGESHVAVGANGTMDVAVFYSDSFVTRWGLATGGRIQFLMAILDQALIDSDTGLRARLVHTGPVSVTTETADLAQTLYNLTGLAPSGESVTQDLGALRTARTTFGADLTAIVMRSQTGQDSCGVAWIIGGSDDDISPTADDHLGYSVSADWIRDTDTPSGGFTFCGNNTFAHEVGHNMGFAHNVENASSGIGMGVRDFAHGHRVDGEFRTIMSYASSTGESRVNYFSNPDINLCPGGAACGIAAAGDFSIGGIDSPMTDDPADNARAAREESFNIASFRPETPGIVSAVLPITRTVQTGSTATAFASIINPAGNGTATGCGLRLPGATGAQFSYQTTTPANALSGTANTAVDIASGGTQNYVFSVTSAADFDDNVNTPGGFSSGNNETELFIEAFCTNRRSAEYTLGLNSLIFRSTAAAPTDIIALAATLPAAPGYVVVPTTGGMTGVFSVAISNVGVTGDVTVSVDTGSQTLAITTITMCQTDPGTGACTDALETTKTLNVPASGTATFGIFVAGNGSAIANDPANNRVFVRFAVGGQPVGATSVAVRTE
ncbi:M12 family metallo-peptidase [Hyphobacterium sp. HN65]|uniref:M12 family metallo-peptidase n=1 Tax=Hyphobacterium lacteum TaxID=3116575 RepID=A0ABU7LMZ2_9PROT|nr:M12 family metallo-peptidase [Hyphobacterium sp. HN65]MEE2524964.1 M12 family metallo-peptidase [Hyphobacterium sp. HN65]